jgi:hypothetical protein
MARSDRSSPNKPVFHGRSWPQPLDLVIPLRARRGDEGGGDPAALGSGGLDLQWRFLHLALLLLSAGLGGRFWRWLGSMHPLLSFVLFLQLSSLLAGRGSEELGDGSSGMGGCVPCAAHSRAFLAAGLLTR